MRLFPFDLYLLTFFRDAAALCYLPLTFDTRRKNFEFSTVGIW
ncbi:MAG: hypothetical protein ABSG32_24265 [Terriglobia bacterium]